jgi:hypothetical protein
VFLVVKKAPQGTQGRTQGTRRDILIAFLLF